VFPIHIICRHPCETIAFFKQYDVMSHTHIQT